ncbi:MAG: sigma-70 family RNA polymerase sigma factor, partial [Thiohalospira sp.]
APHVPALYRIAHRYTGSADEAEDLVQELLTRLYPRRRELAEVRVLRPWLLRSLHNLHVDRVRREARRPGDRPAESAEGGAVDVEHLSGDAPTPEELAAGQWTTRQLQAALDALNTDQRAVVVLHDVEGHTLEELASILETPVGTLKSRLHRARGRLRERLIDAGMEPSAVAARERG